MLDVRELATTELTQGLESLRNRVATDPFCAPFARASWPGDAGLQCKYFASCRRHWLQSSLAAPVPRQLSKTLGGGSKMSIETKTLLLSHQGFSVDDGGHLALEVDGANWQRCCSPLLVSSSIGAHTLSPLLHDFGWSGVVWD